MNTKIQHILISAIVLSLTTGVVVTIIGLGRGWTTSTQFSNGFFWAGAIMISLGLVSVMGGGQSERTLSELQNGQSAVHPEDATRFRIWAADILHGNNVLAFLGIAGLLLLGLAGLVILIGRVS